MAGDCPLSARGISGDETTGSDHGGEIIPAKIITQTFVWSYIRLAHFVCRRETHVQTSRPVFDSHMLPVGIA